MQNNQDKTVTTWYKVNTILLFVAFVGGSIWMTLYVNQNHDEIVQQGSSTIGYCTKGTGYKTSAQYKFWINGQMYDGSFARGGSDYFKKNRFYLVRYMKDDPERSIIIVDSLIDEYKEYGVKTNAIVVRQYWISGTDDRVIYKFMTDNKSVLDSTSVPKGTYAVNDTLNIIYSSLRTKYPVPMRSMILGK